MLISTIDPAVGRILDNAPIQAISELVQFVHKHQVDYGGLDLEHDNLFGILSWANRQVKIEINKESRNTIAGQLVELLTNLDQFYSTRGYYNNAIEHFQWGIEAAQTVKGAKKNEAIFCHTLAEFQRDQGHYAAARELFYRALTIEREIHDLAGQASALHGIAILEDEQGNNKKAIRLLRQSHKIDIEIGSDSGQAHDLYEMGRIEFANGNLAKSRGYFEETLLICEKIGDEKLKATALHGLGNIEATEEHYEKARLLYEQSLTIESKIGHEYGRATTLATLAYISIDLNEKKKLNQEALDIMLRIGDAAGAAAIWRNMGHVARQEGDIAEAARLYRISLGIFEHLEAPQAEKVRKLLLDVESS